MKNFEILEHKADIKIKVFGKTMEELYKNAAWAMASILYKNLKLKTKNFPPEAGQPLAEKLTKTLIAKSVDREVLLVDFLNDILGESQINQAIYPEVRFLDFQPDGIKGAYLKAEIIGYLIERFDEDIKAATYHDLSIHQNENGVWEAIILFDV